MKSREFVERNAGGSRTHFYRVAADRLAVRPQRQVGLEKSTLTISSRSELSCGGRNRTCDKAINSRPPVPTQDPPH
jgi:hypothetical protein